MAAGCVIEGIVGLLCVVLGLLIWKKKKLSLVHEYHYKNVKKEDIPAYARLLGIGVITVGGGIGVTGLLNWFRSPFWWIPLFGGTAAGILMMHRAQKKYNGSWFS